MRSAWFVVFCLIAVGTWLTAPAVASMHADVTFRLHSQNRSGENGSATLTDLGDGKTRVVIRVINENTTGNQPAHIHPGRCRNLNPIPRYVLKNVILGRSNTVIDVPMEKVLGGHWSINVHESPDNLKRYVSCGNIP